MSILTSVYAIADAFDPGRAYWSVETTAGKVWSERSLVPTWTKGIRGVRKLDWLWDIVGTGDIKHLKFVTLHCPDGRKAILEMTEPGERRAKWPAFQFRTRSVGVMGGGDRLEYLVIGRVIDPAVGWCECFIWDYFPKETRDDKGELIYREPNLVAWHSNIHNFGAWRDTMTPLTELNMEVQGFKL